jgi:hypothetical protein
MIPFAGWGATAGKFGRTAARGLWKVTKEGTVIAKKREEHSDIL